MSETEAPGQLERLIEAAAHPPTPARSSVRSLLRRVALRVGQVRAGYQRRVDLELVEEIARLKLGQAELLHELRRVAGGVSDLRGWVENTSGRTDALGGRTEDLAARLESLTATCAELRADLIRRTPDLSPIAFPPDAGFAAFDAGLGGEVQGFRTPGRPAAIYRGFEDFFRGSEDEIRSRQQVYLPLLAGRGPVLDVGCGRGELLDLLRDAGVPARGIDVDAAMVQRCREKQLEAEQVDVISCLEQIGRGEVRSIVAAQVVEHLSYLDLLRFLELARDKLGPGGRVIVETVNPHSPQALKNFWIDPTHRNPLFPETMLALFRLAGFGPSFIWYPQGTGQPDRDRLEQHDYSIVADLSEEVLSAPDAPPPA